MKKSKILQLNNAFIQSERKKKLSINWQNANKKIVLWVQFSF